MAGYRFWLQCSASVVLALAIVQVGRSQTDAPPSVFQAAVTQASKAVSTGGSTCKVYSLRDLGDDANLCKWIAETIPDVIQPGTWKQNGVKLSYYAPSKILVVTHTSAVHAQVDEFLQNLKKSQAQPQGAAGWTKYYPPLQQVQAPGQDAMRSVGPMQTRPSSYPVPYPPQAPKHLFHFIIRYEGDGVIDANVAKFAKALSMSQEKSVSATNMPTATYAVSGASSALVPPPFGGYGYPPPQNSCTPSGTPVPPAPSRCPMPPADPVPAGGSPCPPPQALPPPPPQSVPFWFFR